MSDLLKYAQEAFDQAIEVAQNLKRFKDSRDADREAYAQLLKEKDKLVAELKAEVKFLKNQYQFTREEMYRDYQSALDISILLMRRLDW